MGIFDAQKGSDRLVVTLGGITPEWAETVTSHLSTGETVTIACPAAAEGVQKVLDDRAPGSRLLQVPNDLFRFDPSTAVKGS